MPSDGSLLRVSEPVRKASSVRAAWEIRTKSENQMYFHWLKNQLGPEYHVTSETASVVRSCKRLKEIPTRL